MTVMTHDQLAHDLVYALGGPAHAMVQSHDGAHWITLRGQDGPAIGIGWDDNLMVPILVITTLADPDVIDIVADLLS